MSELNSNTPTDLSEDLEVSTDAASESAAAPEASKQPTEAPPAVAKSEAEATNDDSIAMSDDFEALVEDYMGKLAEIQRGKIVDARVVEVHREYVLVDFGDKSEAFVNIAEFEDPQGEINVTVGETIPVLIGDRNDETGGFEVSYTKAREARAWDRLKESFDSGSPVTGVVARTIKGGLEVSIEGVRAFCPASHTDVRRIDNLESLVGQSMEMTVLELNINRGRAVVSRRALLEKELEKKRQELWVTLQEDQELKVTVKSICDFGVFCDLGGVDGLIPREELSWDRGAKPADCVVIGDEIRVKVMSFNTEKGKISLSRRRTKPDPWDTVQDTCPEGSVVDGKVVGLTSYGAFVRIAEGITGLLHAQDLTWDRGAKNPSEYVKEGDAVKVKVLEINMKKRQLALGLKQTMSDPWLAIPEKFPIGTHHKGTVISLTKFGAFVKIDEGVEGLVHISDLSWDKNIRRASDILKEGEEVNVEVQSIDVEARRISLSMKSLQENPISVFLFNHPVNSIVEGKVSRLTDFGAFVELAPGIDGLVHVSQISEDRIERADQALKVGDEVKALIIKAEERSGKISLSIKDYLRRQEKKEMKEFLSGMNTQHGGHNLGDLLRNAAILVDDTPAKEESTPEVTAEAPTPVAEETAPTEEAPIAEEAPAEETTAEAEAPVEAEVTPAAEPEAEAPTPVAEETAPTEEAPAAEEAPAEAEAPVEAEVTPAAEPEAEAPAAEETPAEETTPKAEAPVEAEATPAAEDEEKTGSE